MTNPASLVMTQVPSHLNEQRLRYLELACLRSDLIVVDEADRVQMTLDRLFAPSATLVSRGPESWLDRLHTHNIMELSNQGRLQLSEPEVARWSRSLETASAATNRIYEMLIGDHLVQGWADTAYFSSWTLQEKLLRGWFPLPGEANSDDPHDDVMAEADVYDTTDETTDRLVKPAGAETVPWYQHREELRAAFDTFRDDPLGDRGPYGTLADRLSAAAADLLSSLEPRRTWTRIGTLLDELLEGSPAPAKEREPDQWHEQASRRLGFTLLLAVLHHRLERITHLWPHVEAALRLDPNANDFSRRPPMDYAALVPESPMGNVLGFQFQRDPEPDREGHTTGTLRFFRCAGVGRELLLSLPDLGAHHGPGRPGPHVMLMSGTSWAGTSTRANLAVQVGAVLKPSSEQTAQVNQTTFATRFLYHRITGQALYLSGQHPSLVDTVLQEMVALLGTPGGREQLSPLEEELGLIPDESRRRLLLLTGSYRQADLAATQLQQIRRWRERVRVLISDDAEVDQYDQFYGNRTPALRRGDLASFAADPNAEILVAPLLAIERGHNILNEKGTAAFGAVLFLARPHPVPDDMMLSVFALNDWATRYTRGLPCDMFGCGSDTPASLTDLVAGAADLGAAGLHLRRAAHGKWHYLLSRIYAYSALSEQERTSFIWDQLVTMWQVIGRLVRGGVAARVVFVDAKFAPGLASAGSPVGKVAGRAKPDTPASSLLVGLHQVLAPYFTGPAPGPDHVDPAEAALVQRLYQPVFDALCRMRESNPNISTVPVAGKRTAR